MHDLNSVPRLFSVQELSQYLGVSHQTIYYWTHRNVIPFFKVGKHLRFDVTAVLEHFRSKPTDSCRLLFTGVKMDRSFRSLETSGASSAASSKAR